MEKEKKGALKNIFRGLFVSEQKGDIIPGISLRDVSTLFSSKSKKPKKSSTTSSKPSYDEPYTEIEHISDEKIQRRYSQIKNRRSLERISNDILKTLVDIRLFEYNKHEYVKSLNEYRSIVSARRHKEVLKVFEDAIGKNKLPAITQSKVEGGKSKVPLLLGGLAVGAVGLLAFKAYSSEIEKEFDETGLKKELDDIGKLTEELQEETIERNYSEFEKDLTEEIDTKVNQIDSTVPNFNEIQREVTQSIEDIPKPEDMRIETVTPPAYPIPPISPAAAEKPTIREEITEPVKPVPFPQPPAGTAATVPPPVTPPAATGPAAVPFPRPSPAAATAAPTMAAAPAATGPAPVTYPRPPAPTAAETDARRAREAAEKAELERENSILRRERDAAIQATLTTPVAAAPPYDEAGRVGGRRQAPVAAAPPYDEAGRVGGRQAVVEARPMFIPGPRIRPDEAAITQPEIIPPQVRFGGFPYQPATAQRIIETPTAVSMSSVGAVSSELQKLIKLTGKTEGGGLGYNATNVPVIKNPEKYTSDERKKIYALLFNEAKIIKGNIDVTTGKRFDKDLTEMTIEEVINLGKRRNKYYEKGYKYGNKSITVSISSASGYYGFVSDTIFEYAYKAFGEKWKEQLFNEENQNLLNTILTKEGIIRAENNKLPISSALLYMQHFFGLYSPNPKKILESKDQVKMTEIMDEKEEDANPNQAKMTVGEYKKDLIRKGFSFEPIEFNKLVSEDDKKKIIEMRKSWNNRYNTPIKNVLSNKLGKNISDASTQNADARRQAGTGSNVQIQQNNRTTVVNQRTVAGPPVPQPNNNPGLRQ